VKRRGRPIRSARKERGSALGGNAHPLVGVFPLTVMALATCLVLFAVMMAGLHAGSDRDPHTGSSAVTVSP